MSVLKPLFVIITLVFCCIAHAQTRPADYDEKNLSAPKQGNTTEEQDTASEKSGIEIIDIIKRDTTTESALDA
ncbi:MAG: phospholipase, partial [Pseudomonadota bacterium]|nr:phospholipase [Pseudomonadota bacterium]